MPRTLSQARCKYDTSNKSIAEKFKTLFRHLTSTYSTFSTQRKMAELAEREAAAEAAAVALMLEILATREPRPNRYEYYRYGASSNFINGELWSDDPRLWPPTYDDRDQLPHYSAEPMPPQYEDCEACRRRQLRRCRGMENLAKAYGRG
jgi:hypothetical protein